MSNFKHKLALASTAATLFAPGIVNANDDIAINAPTIVDTTTETPVETPVETAPDETPVETPVEVPVETTPVEPPVETPAEPPVETPPTETPVEPEPTEPTQPPVEVTPPTEPPIEQPTPEPQPQPEPTPQPQPEVPIVVTPTPIPTPTPQPQPQPEPTPQPSEPTIVEVPIEVLPPRQQVAINALTVDAETQVNTDASSGRPVGQIVDISNVQVSTPVGRLTRLTTTEDAQKLEAVVEEKKATGETKKDKKVAEKKLEKLPELADNSQSFISAGMTLILGLFGFFGLKRRNG